MEIALEKAQHVVRTAIFGLFLVLFLLLDIAWSVRQHHDQGLVINAVKDVLPAPAGGVGHLPDQTEGAMTTLIAGA